MPRAADDDAAMMAAIAASEQEAARMRLHEDEHDAELQAALQASQREMAVLPREFAEGAQSPNPFDDDPFADEPQPQPAPATPPQFDVFAALRVLGDWDGATMLLRSKMMCHLSFVIVAVFVFGNGLVR